MRQRVQSGLDTISCSHQWFLQSFEAHAKLTTFVWPCASALPDTDEAFDQKTFATDYYCKVLRDMHMDLETDPASFALLHLPRFVDLAKARAAYMEHLPKKTSKLEELKALQKRSKRLKAYKVSAKCFRTFLKRTFAKNGR